MLFQNIIFEYKYCVLCYLSTSKQVIFIIPYHKSSFVNMAVEERGPVRGFRDKGAWQNNFRDKKG